MTASCVSSIIQNESGLVERTAKGFKCRVCDATGESPDKIHHTTRCRLARLMGKAGALELISELYAGRRSRRSTVSLI